ncbi:MULTISPECIES: cell division protein SepF [unclassified Corynebacterium]|uniref:cell division protein SepF n=1 Tax=unclassified Corynebacterium TaxID=2624378 RepID=UPI00216AA72C|nr:MULTISPECIES: cell division protein SepF [unclassified Corynebacterium]MCS4489020.1 cell division protein SepF [Corynebacterium sp. ES2775-CONJ]MCS4490833.1 cell division protein SepF [Corynebacterium sp. ES2715-CONJ3]MCS4531284.1 cell division protein SepF [Corynebacterium sp. ES2730-CONJ]
MSLFKSTKEFFFGADPDSFPYDSEDAYFEEPQSYDRTPSYAREREDHYATRTRVEASVVSVKIYRNNDAVKIGEPFRDGDAVVFDLAALDAKEAKGIVDFAAGLCYALRGRMVKLENRIFAVIPEHCDLDSEQLKKAAHIH